MFGCQVDFAFVHGHKSYVSGHDLWTPMLYDASGLGDVCGMYIDLDEVIHGSDQIEECLLLIAWRS